MANSNDTPDKTKLIPESPLLNLGDLTLPKFPVTPFDHAFGNMTDLASDPSGDLARTVWTNSDSTSAWLPPPPKDLPAELIDDRAAYNASPSVLNRETNIRTETEAETDTAPPTNNKELVARSMEQVGHIIFRHSHDNVNGRSADFRIDKDGKIIQTGDPTLAKPDDDSVVVEIDDSAGDKVREMNMAQRIEAATLFAILQNTYKYAQLEAPPEIFPQDQPIPPVHISIRGPGGMYTNYGKAAMGYSLGGSGSFLNYMPGMNYRSITGRSQIDVSKLSNSVFGNNSAIRIGKVMMGFETDGKLDAITLNDNGHGISACGWQANQGMHTKGGGELPDLLAAMQHRDPELFQQIMGKDFAKIIHSDPEQIRFLSFTNASRTALNDLGHRLKHALQQPIFQQVQLDMLSQKIIEAAHVAQGYGIRSEKGVALVADMINQLGETQARRYLRYALGKDSEVNRLQAIVAHDYQGDRRGWRDRSILHNPELSLNKSTIG